MQNGSTFDTKFEMNMSLGIPFLSYWEKYSFFSLSNSALGTQNLKVMKVSLIKDNLWYSFRKKSISPWRLEKWAFCLLDDLSDLALE